MGITALDSTALSLHEDLEYLLELAPSPRVTITPSPDRTILPEAFTSSQSLETTWPSALSLPSFVSGDQSCSPFSASSRQAASSSTVPLQPLISRTPPAPPRGRPSLSRHARVGPRSIERASSSTLSPVVSASTPTKSATSTPTRPGRRLSQLVKYRTLRRSRQGVSPATPTIPQSPTSSFYSSSSASSSNALSSNSAEKSLLSFLQQPRPPCTPQRSRSHTSSFHFRSPFGGSPKQLFAGARIFSCAIHSLSSDDHHGLERQCKQRVVDGGGKLLDRVLPGGFLFSLPSDVEQPLADGATLGLGQRIEVASASLVPRFGLASDPRSTHFRTPEPENKILGAQISPTSFTVDDGEEHHEWCDGEGDEVELWGGKAGSVKEKHRKWFGRVM